VPLLKPLRPVHLNVENAISATEHDLNAGPYSGSSSISSDYILSHIQFHFTTTASRNITVTASNGTIIWSETGNTNLDVKIENIDEAFNGGQNFTITVSQTGAACVLNVLAVVLT
jgi:hypothetical protein